MKLLSVSHVVREFAHALKYEDLEGYDFERVSEQVYNNVEFIGSEAVRGLEELAEVEGIGGLFNVMQTLRDFEEMELGEVVTDFADREQVASSLYRRIVESVARYVEGLYAENNAEVLTHLERLQANEWNNEVANFNDIYSVEVNDDYDGEEL